MTVKLVTFKTNHTVIAQVEFKDREKMLLKEPVQVVMQPSKEGPMIGFGPFLEYAKEFKTGIEVCMSDVLCITTPMVELENQYNEFFGSGIQIASAIPKF